MGVLGIEEPRERQPKVKKRNNHAHIPPRGGRRRTGASQSTLKRFLMVRAVRYRRGLPAASVPTLQVTRERRLPTRNDE